MRDLEPRDELLPPLRVLTERRISAILHMHVYAMDVVRGNALDLTEDIGLDGEDKRPFTLAPTGRWLVLDGLRWIEAPDTDGHMIWLALNPDRIGRKAVEDDKVPRTIVADRFGEIIEHPVYRAPNTAKTP